MIQTFVVDVKLSVFMVLHLAVMLTCSSLQVTAIEPISNDGGASVSTRHLHQSLRWLFGVAAVATDVGHVLLVDLCLDDLSCSQNEVEASDLEVVTRIPAEVPQRREAVMSEGRHLCFQLRSPSGTAVSTLCYISRSNQLVVGFSDGYLSLGNMKTLKRADQDETSRGGHRGYCFDGQKFPHLDCCIKGTTLSLEEEGFPSVPLLFKSLRVIFKIVATYGLFSLHNKVQLPWQKRNSVQQTNQWFPAGIRNKSVWKSVLHAREGLEFSEGNAVNLHLLQLVFGDRKCLASGQVMYEGFAYCVQLFSLDLSDGIFPWRGQISNTKFLSFQIIEKIRNHADREDSVNEVRNNVLSLTVISPDTSVSIFSWQVNTYGQGKPSTYLGVFDINRWYHAQMPDSLRENTRACVLTDRLENTSFSIARVGIFFYRTLKFLKKSGPLISEAIRDSYTRCLVAGLLSPRLVDVQPSSLTQTIYLLLDIMHSFPNKTETLLVSFPTAFAIPWGLVKLIRGFWLLDHDNYEKVLTVFVAWLCVSVVMKLLSTCPECPGPALPSSYNQDCVMAAHEDNSVPHVPGRAQESPQVHPDDEAVDVQQQRSAAVPHRQHTTKLNIEELLKHMYEICQEMGLMEDLLKLPFTDTEKVSLEKKQKNLNSLIGKRRGRIECLEKFLQTKSGVQNREFLLVHHLQRANYIPALQLNQSMKTSLTVRVDVLLSFLALIQNYHVKLNDRDPRLRERAVARNSLLDQYIKILPTVQRKLAVERAKPYRLPSSVLREVPRPKPLSTATRQANAGNVHIRTSFINKVLSRFKEAWLGNKKTNFSEYNKLLDLVVHPVPSRSVAQDESQQSPCRASTSFVASSPLRSNTHRSSSQKNLPRASELNLLETPLVVKVCILKRNLKKNLSVVMTEALSIGDPKLYFTLLEADYDSIKHQFVCDLPQNNKGECDAAGGIETFLYLRATFQIFCDSSLPLPTNTNPEIDSRTRHFHNSYANSKKQAHQPQYQAVSNCETQYQDQCTRNLDHISQMSFIRVRPRKGVSSYSDVLTSDFRLANNRELNTTLVEAINQFCFGEGSSWRIYTTPNFTMKHLHFATSLFKEAMLQQLLSETFLLSPNFRGHLPSGNDLNKLSSREKFRIFFFSSLCFSLRETEIAMAFLICRFQYSHICRYGVKATASNDIHSLFCSFFIVFQGEENINFTADNGACCRLLHLISLIKSDQITKTN
ncbi:hypothetical protein IHE44_0009126 [Lamprotornis superbus]|uniref:Uncharacterized protein n=1 Tax=Lamprotornis superbus TaxID=245042 RepID=A0A835TYY7_9PASS|nr:hypothetical protein IHE44_0009126 [Lamprotornis superbus]